MANQGQPERGLPDLSDDDIRLLSAEEVAIYRAFCEVMPEPIQQQTWETFLVGDEAGVIAILEDHLAKHPDIWKQFKRMQHRHMRAGRLQIVK